MMGRLRSHNNRKLREQRRLKAKGKLTRNPAVRRWLRIVTKRIALALDCPERPWFRLTLDDDMVGARKEVER